MSSPASLCLRQLLDDVWIMLERPISTGGAPGRQREEQSGINVAYAIAFPLASIREDLYSFTCCPDSSVVERHLGKMEVPGSIPGRGSLINSCESTY